MRLNSHSIIENADPCVEPRERLIFHCQSPPLLETALVCGLQNHRRLDQAKEAGSHLIRVRGRGDCTVAGFRRLFFRCLCPPLHPVPATLTWSLVQCISMGFALAIGIHGGWGGGSKLLLP